MGRKETNVIATLENEKELLGTGRYIPYFSESPVLTNKQWKYELSMEQLAVKSSRLRNCVISLLLDMAMGTWKC